MTNPVGFQGRHVRISIFNAFAPLVHLGALQSVASQLDLELLEIVAEPYAVARVLGARAGAAGRGAVHRRRRRHDRRRARARRAASRARACSRSAAGPSPSRWPTGWTCPSRAPRRSRSTTPAACRSSEAETVAAIVGRGHGRLGGRASSWCWRSWPAGDLLPGRIYLCGGGSRLPETRRCPARRGLLRGGCRSRRPPEVVDHGAGRGRVDHGRDASCWSTSRTSRRSAWPTRRSRWPSQEDPLDAALRRVLRAMKV